MIKKQKSNDILFSINNAYKICKNIMRNAYSTNGINAGETHFSDVWIRDSSFASWGALEMGDETIVKEFLLHTMKNMKYDGQCPLRIGQKYFLLKYIGLKGPQGPTYIEDKYVSIPMDSNSLIIIVFALLMKRTNNTDFAAKYYHQMKQAINWYEHHLVDGLIHEGPYAGWADSIKKRGTVLYTNVLYYEAMKCMEFIATGLNILSDIRLFNTKKDAIKSAIQTAFWNGSYLNDWVHKGHIQSTFSIEANMMAILFEITTNTQSEKIIQYMLTNNVITEFGSPVVYTHYKLKDIYPPFIPIGLKDYHNGLIWFWISCLTSVVLHYHHYNDQAIKLMNIMSEKINRHKTVFEVYTKKGVPVKRLFYQSERGFAWSAGLFVWACNKLRINNP